MCVTEKELWHKYKESGDVKMRNELIEKFNYLYLVDYLIDTRLNIMFSWIEKDELKSISYICLLYIMDNYNPNINISFSTYLFASMPSAILNELGRSGVQKRRLMESVNKMHKATNSLQQDLERHPTEEEIAEHLNMSLEKIQTIKVKYQNANPLYFFSEMGKDNVSLYDTLDDKTVDVEMTAINHVLYEHIKELVKKNFSERDAMIFDLYTDTGLNYSSIGIIISKKYGQISKEGVRLIVKKTIKKLQSMLRKEGYDV